MRIVEMATKLPPWPAARNRRNRVRLMLNPGARRPHAPGRQLFHCQAGNRLALLLLVLTCVAYSGCTYMPLEPHTAVQRDMLQTEALLLYSQSLLQADSPRRMAMLNIARAAYERNPLPMNVARLALAYGQPGYKGYAPENGWRYADKALTHDNADWAPTAAAYLRQFAMLSKENSNVHQMLANERKQREALEEQLAEATRKLHSITLIEPGPGR